MSFVCLFVFSISGKESIIAGPFSWPVVRISMILQNWWMQERYVVHCIARVLLVILVTCPLSLISGNSPEVGLANMHAALQ